MVDNAERAIGEAARATDAEVAEYTVAPVFMEADTKGPTSGSWSSKGSPQTWPYSPPSSMGHCVVSTPTTTPNAAATPPSTLRA